MAKQQTVSIEAFLERFPFIELPITLSTDSHHLFSEENQPLQPLMIQQFIMPYDEDDVDEFTEFIPCFSIPNTEDFHAIVYWKAGLMKYEYYLMTFSKKEELIDKQFIAGTIVQNSMVTHAITTIDEDWIISVIEGDNDVDQNEENYNATSSRVRNLELMDTGKINKLYS